MADFVDEMMAEIRERVVFESDAIGVEMVEHIRETISVPVEHVGEHGDRVIRSKPGEYPRREYGHLWESTRHEVEEIGDTVRVDVINDAAYAARLEYELDRAFMGPALAFFESQIGPRLRDAIET